jgi:chemotaxis protein methyltransferase CheR
MNVAAILSDLQYPELKSHILRHTGLWYYADKDEDLASRVARRISARGFRTGSEYLHLLRDGVAGVGEMDALVGELTIGETYFFRQREHFDILRDTVFPDLLQRNQASRRIRIWSAGCATGAEPYSINMLLELELAQRIGDWDVSILATDINSEFLARAREARFGDWAFRETPESVKLRCFERQGKSWLLRPEFRRRVTFQHHNLAGDHPLPGLPAEPFDVVMCRNVMIYFAPDLIRSTVGRFYQKLAAGGWLLVGHAEPNADMFAQFDRVSAGNVTVYRRPLSGVPAAPPPWPQWTAVPAAPQPSNSHPRVPPTAGARRAITRPPLPAAPPAATPRLEAVRLLADRGNWTAAAALGRQLTATDPLNAPAHFTLGLILEHTTSCEEAESALRRAIYLDRQFALAHYHLGTCLQQGRQTEKARKAFRNVLELLTTRPEEETVEHGDGMTVAELKDLARMHLDLVGSK